MNAERTVLVVAPDDGLRRSLKYLLESEGLEVLARHGLADLSLPWDSPPFGCAVIDDQAIESHDEAWDVVRGFSRPVVVLIGRWRTMPDRAVLAVEKPHLGKPLVDAILSLLPSVDRATQFPLGT